MQLRWDERVAGSASAARQDSSLLLALMEQNLREQKSCLMQIFALVVGGCGDPAAVRKDAGRVQAVERVIKAITANRPLANAPAMPRHVKAEPVT